MPQQIKGNENDLISENPEQNKGNPDKKSKESPPKKKEFKIKKRIQASSKKLNHVDIFNNPIYEGLLNQEQNDQNQQNFGPWIHQDFALSNQSVMRNSRVAQNQFQNLMLNQFSQNKNFQQNQASQMVQNVQNISRAASYSQVYLQIPVRSAILQQNENTSISYLPQIRLKKHNQELRLSSLDFSPERKQSKKSLTCNLLPPKLQKHKQLLINRNRSQGQTADLLLYQSLKSSYSSQKLVNKKLLSKPSNVIYNYCYSNNENNMVLNYFKDQNYGLPRKSTYIANKTENNDQILVLKLNRKQIIEGRIFQKYSELENKKKSISKELYEELIRKKNKCK